MKVRDLCVCDVVTVTRETNLARAGELMRKYQIGSVPVIDRSERVIGMLTDRDCFLAVARQNESPSEIYADEAMTSRPACCTAQDDVLDCLEIMKKHRVRRLPVVDEEDRVEGIISIDDIVYQAQEGRNGRDLPYEEVINAVCEITTDYQAETRTSRERQESRTNGGRARSLREEAPEVEGSRGRAGRIRRGEGIPSRPGAARARG
jgi:CBS domain-containing protein